MGSHMYTVLYLNVFDHLVNGKKAVCIYNADKRVKCSDAHGAVYSAMYSVQHIIYLLELLSLKLLCYYVQYLQNLLHSNLHQQWPPSQCHVAMH